MDNFKVDIESDQGLVYALRVGFGEYRSSVWSRKAHGYVIHPATADIPTRMVFYHTRPKDIEDYITIAVPADSYGASERAVEWLEAVEYPRQSEMTYHQRKAWRVTNDYRLVGPHSGALVAVLPVWAEYSQ